MSTEAPIEKLEVDPATLGKALVGVGHAFPFGVSADVAAELDKDLDPARIKQKPGGGNKRYLAEHDVLRTANRIFGYGRWGTEVVELVPLGAHQVTNAKNEQGWYVGYRCTVRLTVAGCVPVDGVGYGDAFEKQWSAVITAHELAVKEAESDAIKRAFKKWGDQFGLILYAKAEDLARIESEKHAAEQEEAQKAAEAEAFATDAEITEVKEMAARVGADVREKTDAAIKAHRDKNETERGWGPRVQRAYLAKLAEGITRTANERANAAGEQARQTGLKTPDGVANTVTDGTAPAEGDVAAAFEA